ncbi:MAG: hypothetical protein AAGD13_11840 [Pseudomonadota bacterium]
MLQPGLWRAHILNAEQAMEDQMDDTAQKRLMQVDDEALDKVVGGGAKWNVLMADIYNEPHDVSAIETQQLVGRPRHQG